MKLLTGILTLCCAIAISIVAGYFSIVGMMALFAGSAIMIGCMMTTLEASKLVAAGWLHSNWKNHHVSKLHKGYLTTAIVTLMLITAMGIFGFLSAAHLSAAAPTAGLDIQLQTQQSRLDQLNADKTRLQQRLATMDAAVNSFIKNDKASSSMHAQATQASERKSISTKMDADDAEITKLMTTMAPLKVQASGAEAKLGPLKYVAALFGWKDPEAAVKLLILMLMFAFDPLAIVLMISATITLGEWKNPEPAVEAAAADLPVAEPPIEAAPPIEAVEPLPVIVEPAVEEVIEVPPPVVAQYSTPQEINIGSIAIEDLIADPEPAVEPLIVPEIIPSPKPRLETLDPQADIFARERHLTDDEIKTYIQEKSSETAEQTTKERLIELLERNPALLEELIVVADEVRSENEPLEAKDAPTQNISGQDAITKWWP